MPAINKIELEFSGELQKSVDNLMTDMNASFDKTKVKSSASALAYMDTLLEIKKDSLKTIDDCAAVSKLQVTLGKEKDFDVFFLKWPPVKEKFKLIHAFVVESLKKHKTVPPITEKLKSEIPPESLAVIERARETTLKWRDAAERNYKQCLKNHNNFNGACLAQLKHMEDLAKAKANAGAGPGAGAVHPAPLSSSHGAQHMSSQQKAEQKASVNRGAEIKANAQNPNGKK